MTTVQDEALERLADQLSEAIRTGRQIALPAPQDWPQSRAEAYRVQDRVAQRLGWAVAGWKAGATSPGMRARDGQDDIIVGRVFAPRFYEASTISLSYQDFAGARAEPEFAFRLTADFPAGLARRIDEVAAHATAHIAIELVASRYDAPTPWGKVGGLLGLADNGSGAALILGAEIAAPEQVDFLRHYVALSIDGGAPAAQSPADIRCAPYVALCDVVNHLSARGLDLPKGSVITTGSASDTQPVLAGTTLTADFGPLGAIRLHFSK